MFYHLEYEKSHPLFSLFFFFQNIIIVVVVVIILFSFKNSKTLLLEFY